MNKELHLEHYRGNEEFVKRLNDLIDQSRVRKRIVITPFFSPDQSALCEKMCGNKIPYFKDGGYVGCERMRYAFSYLEECTDFKISELKADVSLPLTHRDVLGALMHLGISRDKIGDIVVYENCVYIFVVEEIANYIICNLTKINRCNVCFDQVEEEVEANHKIRDFQIIVSSLRLDTIVSAFTHCTRKEAQLSIHKGFVKVDHVVLEQSAYLCNNNNAISIRGYGRYQIKGVLKKTKKDRFVIEVGVYE